MRRHKKRRIRKLGGIAWILLIVAVIGCAIPVALTNFGGEDMRLIQDGGEEDGRLRILLKSLGSPKQLTLTLDGNYALESDPGFRFARGSVLKIAAEEGSLWLDCAGLTINMGRKFTLTRHADPESDTNGIYIVETERNNLYNGDLTLEAKDGGISALMHMDIEEYLYGVVPYEMSDSWPVEALKAQAVAARTYAMDRKSARAGAEYDLVDTTADQVFKGYNAEWSNAIGAVDATKGIVGMYKGNFAGCYYTASNGGQTAMPDEIWGRAGDYDYLCVQDDPYDIENPLSVVRTMEFSADGSQLDETLASLLKAALSEQLIGMGYSEDAEDIRIVRVDSVQPIDPKGRAGSRMAQTLRFTLQLEARAWQIPEANSPSDTQQEMVLGDFAPLESPLQADIGLYTQIKETFDNMDFNSSDCELYSVIAISADGKEREVSLPSATPSEAEEEWAEPVSYRLEARRYGHGVGMSQRGAQRMAGAHGLSYTDILLFYYPGMDLVRYTMPAAQLTNLDELPEGMGIARVIEILPDPTPAPLPALEAGECYGTVSTDSTPLNVRQQPGTGFAILDTLSDGQRLIICEELDGWYRIKTAEVAGYVSADYVIKD